MNQSIIPNIILLFIINENGLINESRTPFHAFFFVASSLIVSFRFPKNIRNNEDFLTVSWGNLMTILIDKICEKDISRAAAPYKKI